METYNPNQPTKKESEAFGAGLLTGILLVGIPAIILTIIFS